MYFINLKKIKNMELNKSQERERTMYQLIAIGCFFAFIFIGWKYRELRGDYAKAETDKVWYCNEHKKIKADYIKISYESDKMYERIILLEMELENK